MPAQNQQITLEMILSAQDRASEAIKKVGHELADITKGAKIGDLSVGLRESLNAVNAELRTAAGERSKAARQAAAEDLNTARGYRDEMLRGVKTHFDELDRLAEEASAKNRARAQADARDALYKAARAHDQQLQESKAWLDKETAQLSMAAEERKKLLGGLTLASWKGGDTTPRWRGEGGRYAKSTLSPDEQRTIAAAIQGEEVLIKANQAAYEVMTNDAHRAYRSIANATEEGLEKQLAAEESGFAKQRVQSQENRRLTLEGVKEVYRGWVNETREGLAKVQAVTASSLQNTLGEQRSYANAVLSVNKELGRDQARIARETARDVAKAARDAAREVAKTEREEARDAASAARAIAAQQARVDKAGGVLGYGLQEGSKGVSRFGGAVNQMRESVEGAMGPLKGFMETGKQMLVWGVGYQAMYGVTDALGKMVTGLITTNDSFEQTTKTFQAFYGDAAPKVVDWLDRFAAKTPATREEVRTAGLTIAALGDNIGQVMSPLEDLATVMGVDLPKAAQAFSDAQEGRFYMLKRDLHVSKEELVRYGLDLNNVSTTFVGAFTSFVRDRFGGATQRTIGTFAQVVSNVGDNFKNLQRLAGQGIFGALKTQIDTLSKALESPILLSWAHRTGTELGHMAQQAITWLNRLWLQIGQGPGALALLQQAVRTAQRVWNGLADIFGFAAGALRLIVGVIQGAIGIFGSFTGSVRGSTDMLRTTIRILGEAIISYKLLSAAIGFGEGALGLWNATVGLANKKLAEQKIATDAQKASTAELTIATEGQTAKNVLLAESEGGVALATEGAAAKQVIATTQTGLLATATTGLSGVMGGLKGVLMATLGPIGIYIGALAATVIAIKDVANAYDILVNKMDPSAKKDISAALTPGGTLPTAAHYQAGPRGGRMQVPGTAGTGNVGALASYLMGVGPVETSGVAKGQTDAYWAYARMLQTGNPDYWIAYLRKHGDVEKHYLAMMDKEGKGQAAREILAGTSSLLTKYGGADSAGGTTASLADMLGKQYSQAVEQFNYDVARGPKGKQNTERLQNALIDLRSAHDLMRQSLIESGKTVTQANKAADAWYGQQLSQIPHEFQTAGGYTPGAPTETGSGGGGAQPAVNPKKALAAFLAKQWAPALDAIRAGKLDQTDIDNLVARYEQLQGAAGVPVTDTRIHHQIKEATKNFVTTLGTQFHNTFARLKMHVRGVTTETVQAIISHMQEVELGAGLPDTTATLQEQLYNYQQRQASPTTKGTPAYNSLQYLQSEAKDQYQHFLSALKTHPDQAKAMIDGMVNLTEQIDRAKKIPWPQTIKDEDAARTKWTRMYDDAIKKGTGPAAGGVNVPTPLYGPYRITTPQYGATQASFGGAAQQNSMAALVSHLQSLVTYWSARARRDEDALRAQQQTAANTMAVAQNTQSLPERLAKAAAGLGLAPEPSNAGAASRARGGFAPMRRN